MFVYCMQALHLSEAEAYRRITVARAARKHAVLLAMLRDGRIHLSGLALLVPVLTPQNRDAVLGRATHKSKRQIEQLVAELAPKADVPSVMRKLPVPRTAPSSGAAEGGDQRFGRIPELLPGTVGARDMAPAALQRQDQGTIEVDGAPEGRELVPGTVAASQALEPGPGTVAASRAPQLVPGTAGAVAEKLERLEARRFAKTAAPRKATPRKAVSHGDSSRPSRHIPAAVRRAVRARDAERCRFVDEQGRRCSERHGLEFHHRRPYAMGGDHSPENISLLCPAHNRYVAELDYGQSAIKGRQTSGQATIKGSQISREEKPRAPRSA